jgi:hypothetical protein
MIWRLLADAVVVVHAGFVACAVLGGLLVLCWRRLFWLHVPVVLWAAGIEFGGWICPLTPLENWLRRQAGLQGYSTGFVEHTILPVLYPEGLTRTSQYVLGAAVLVVNLAIYAVVLARWRRARRSSGGAALRH